MKRKNNLYEQIYSLENLKLADINARKGKTKQTGIKIHDRKRDKNIIKLHENLKNKTYKTSKYKIATIQDSGKEREL